MSEAKKYGWTGQGLRINLTTGEITKVPTQKDWIGGTALGYKIFWDEVPPKTQAFDEANKIVIAPGPLTGTGASAPAELPLPPCIRPPIRSMKSEVLTWAETSVPK